MSNVYVGDCSYAETADSVLSIDPWGMDSLTRFIEGRVDQLPQYLSTLKRKRDIQDSEYKGLYLWNYRVTSGRAFAKAEINFAGVFTNEIPEPVFTPGYRAQSVSLPYAFADSSSGITATFEYIAPFTQVQYAVKDKPLVQKYRGYVQCSKDSLQIVGRTGAFGDIAIWKGRFLNTQTAAQLSGALDGTGNAYNAVAESITTQFTPQQVGGPWWRVTENNEVRLQPLDLFNGGFFAQL